MMFEFAFIASLALAAPVAPPAGAQPPPWMAPACAAFVAASGLPWEPDAAAHALPRVGVGVDAASQPRLCRLLATYPGAPQALSGAQGNWGGAAGDLDANGTQALVLGGHSTGAGVVVLLGHGDGTFGAPSFLPAQPAAGAALQSLVAADFDGDGHLDLAATTSGPAAAYVMLGRGDGTFHAAVAVDTLLADA